MRRFAEIVAHELGFKNMLELLSSAIGWKNSLFAFMQFSGATLSVLIGFTKEWIWDPPSAFIVFALLVLSESLTGTLVAIRIKKERFEFTKFYNILPKLVAHLFFLVVSFHLGKANPLLFFLPNATFGWFATRNFLATLFNCVELKWVKGEFAQYIKSKISAGDKELAASIDKDLNDKAA